MCDILQIEEILIKKERQTTVFYQVLNMKVLTQILQGVKRETIRGGLSEGVGGWSRTSRMNHIRK